MKTPALVTCLVLAACSGAPERTGDASAVLACQNFIQVRLDAGNGILSEAEIRDRLKEVHTRARLSEDPEVREPSVALLASATGGGGDAAAAVERFTTACQRHLTQ